VYTKEEIKKEWADFGKAHLENMRGDKMYVTCTAECEDEAVVLIALMMRRTGKGPCNFYYDQNSKKLLACCPKPDVNNPTIKELYESVISTFLGEKSLKYMDKDPVGKKLFDNGKLEPGEAKATMSNCNIIPWTGKLHPHINMINDLGTTPPLSDM